MYIDYKEFSSIAERIPYTFVINASWKFLFPIVNFSDLIYPNYIVKKKAIHRDKPTKLDEK